MFYIYIHGGFPHTPTFLYLSYLIFIVNHDRPFMVILTWSVKYGTFIISGFCAASSKTKKAKLIYAFAVDTVTPGTANVQESVKGLGRVRLGYLDNFWDHQAIKDKLHQ